MDASWPDASRSKWTRYGGGTAELCDFNHSTIPNLKVLAAAAAHAEQKQRAQEEEAASWLGYMQA